jgi:hypothetical protein
MKIYPQAKEQKKQRFAVELELRRQWNAKDCENKKNLDDLTQARLSVETRLVEAEEVIRGGSTSMNSEELLEIQLRLQKGINRYETNALLCFFFFLKK